MLHNDISNCAGLTIGFRFEDTISVTRGNSLYDLAMKVKNFGKIEFDKDVLNVMEDLYRNTPFNVDIVIQEEHYTDRVKNQLKDVAFGRVVLIQKDVQITQRIRMGDLCFYVDNDEYRRSLINSDRAVPLRDLLKYIDRRKYRYV